MSREFQKNPQPPNVALPTVGRIVLFKEMADSIALPAMVVRVFHGSLTIENLTVFDFDGMHLKTSVPHVSDIGVRHGVNNPSWDWMDYQKGQAAKTEELERKLAGAQGGAPTNDPGQA